MKSRGPENSSCMSFAYFEMVSFQGFSKVVGIGAFSVGFRAFGEAQKCENSGKLVILEAGGAGRVRIGMGSRQKHFRGGVG